jgi:hypothetical protein
MLETDSWKERASLYEEDAIFVAEVSQNVRDELKIWYLHKLWKNSFFLRISSSNTSVG